MQALTPAEMLKVLKVASASKRNHAMILCAFRFGMRASEVCGLRLSDIDMKDGAITIRRLKGSQAQRVGADKRTGSAAAIRCSCSECLARRAQNVAGRVRFRVRISEGRQA